jgi:anti-sigma B factor antagonist
MGQFEARTTDEDGLVRVRLAGECDLAVSAQLDEALIAAVRRAPLVVVDLSALVFLDSSGVHALVTAHHAARDRGGRLLAVHAAGAVATVLELTGVGPLLSEDAPGNGS